MSIEQFYRTNRTCLCTVVFLDIVEYSRQTVGQQLEIKQRFNVLLDEVIAPIDSEYRLILDTGDGAALCCFGDPEEALLVVLRLRDALHEQVQRAQAGMRLRIGINLGPVRVVKDLNGQYNTIGDGINVAQRVMNFAEPNQILVSRSFYEVVACLSHEYPPWFNYRGLHKDKHVREHAIYEVVPAQPQMTQESREDKVRQEPPEAPALVFDVPVPPLSAAWSPEFLQGVRALLSTFLGPVARVLVTRAAQHTVDGPALSQMLADQIPTERERREFLRRVATLMPAVSAASASPTAPAVGPDSPSPAPVAHVTLPAVPSVSWDPGVLQTATHCLSRYLGPLAKVLVQRAAHNTSDLAALYRMLAEHLPTAQEKTSFLREAGFPS
jgi:class 3 adenylate cyclase